MPHGVATKIIMITKNCHKSLTKSASNKCNSQIQTYINIYGHYGLCFGRKFAKLMKIHDREKYMVL